MKYFIAEKNPIMRPEEVLKIKQRYVSGEATSFIIESLKVVGMNFYEKESNLKKALFWMGSLTQFTDDLRDLENDRKKGNLNLIIAIERELKNIEGVKKKWAKMYVKEEQKMVSCLELSKISDIEIFKAIPWHPFFMKHLA